MSALPTPDIRNHPSLSFTDDGARDTQPGPNEPLDEAHFQQLRNLSRHARPAMRAAGYAKFSGWTTMLAGAVSIPFALGSIPMLIFCVCLAGIGTRELTLRRCMLRLETATPRKLAVNQLMLGAALIAYSVYMLIFAPSTSMVESAVSSDPMLQSTPELGAMVGDLAQMERVAKALLYLGLIVIAVCVQGGTALYYASRTGGLRRLHKHCPRWTVRVHQTMHEA